MKISLIAAMADNRVIGLNNAMPWHLSADLKRFKQITLGAPVLMGRKTFESIGKPLPGRTMLIVSRNRGYRQPGCEVFQDLAGALAKACALAPEVFIVGGADLYRALLPCAQTLYLTEIHRDFPGDTFFPPWNADEWREIEREDVRGDQADGFDYSFVTLRRRPASAAPGPEEVLQQA